MRVGDTRLAFLTGAFLLAGRGSGQLAGAVGVLYFGGGLLHTLLHPLHH